MLFMKGESKMHKKFLPIIAVMLLLAIVLTGCGKGETPEQAVTSALNAIKNEDWETAEKYFTGEFSEEDLENSEDEGEILNLLFRNLSFNIVSSSEDGDTATVKTELTNIDMNVLMKEYIREAMAIAMENALAGDDAKSDEEMEAEIQQLLTDLLEKEDNETVTTTIDINLTKQDNSWIIEADDEFLDALSGGFFTVADSFGNLE